MLPIMATVKKICRDLTKIGFFGSPRKKAKLHKVLSLARVRSQTLGRYCIMYYIYIRRSLTILGCGV